MMKCCYLAIGGVLAATTFTGITASATTRITDNAMLHHHPSSSSSSSKWGLPRDDKIWHMEQALVRSESIEDRIRLKSTKSAFRKIDQSPERSKTPQTELEFLESSMFLPKSIR